MSIVEILDSENLNSLLIEAWIKECLEFKKWYAKSGADVSNEIEMHKAYLRIEPLIYQKNAKRI
jgi:hypothetical protein